MGGVRRTKRRGIGFWGRFLKSNFNTGILQEIPECIGELGVPVEDEKPFLGERSVDAMCREVGLEIDACTSTSGQPAAGAIEEW
jgi:hypothetical protein